MAGERFADQGERTHVERLMKPAMGDRNAIAEPAAVTELADEGAAFGVDVVAMGFSQVRFAPVFKVRRQLPVRIVEERPIEEGAISHQSPSNSGVRFAAKASKARRKSLLAMQIAWACASISM